MNLLKLLPLLLLLCSDISAQLGNSYVSFTTKNGLPSNECYGLVQDGKGYVWAATDHGLARLDGYGVRTYTTQDGLADNTILRLRVNPKGELWCLGLNGKLSYRKNDGFVPFRGNQAIDELSRIDGNGRVGFDFAFDEAGELVILFGDSKKSTCRFKGDKPDGLSSINNLDKDYNVVLQQYFDDNIIIGRREQTTSSSKVKREGDKLFVHLPISISEPLKALTLKNGNIFFVGKTKAWILKGQHLSKEIPLQEDLFVTSLFEDKFGNLWILSRQKDPLIYNPKRNEWIKIPDELSGVQVNWIAEDDEGNTWFSTHEQGVRKVSSTPFFSHLETGNQKFVRIRKVNKALYTSTSTANLYKLESSNFLNYFSPKIKNDNLRNILDFEFVDKETISFASLLTLFDLSGNQKYLSRKAIKCILRKNDALSYLGSNKGLIAFNPQTRSTEYIDHKDFRLRTNAICEDPEGRIWLGTTEGLFKLEENDIEAVASYRQKVGSRILDMHHANNKLYMATRGEGVVIMQDENYKTFRKSEGLLSDMYECLFVQNDTTIWAGSRVGLSCIFLDQSHKLKYVKNFTSESGLPSNEINDIAIHDDILWLATSSGMVSFDLNYEFPQSKDVKLQFGKFYIHKKEFLIGDEMVYSHDQNNIAIEYSALSFNSGDKIRYKYRLVGVSESWEETEDRRVSFSNLAPGEYTFELIAANKDNKWSDKAKQIHFKIKKHFSQTHLFRLAMLLLLGLLIYYLFKRNSRNQQKKYEIRSRMAELEQLALSNSMNPHFIFNALNSIQSNINQEKLQSASKMLIGFSKLIRLNLQSRLKKTITLKECFTKLELYIETEKLRVKDMLNYEISIADDLDDEVEIPSMLVQPFVENAIWHGVLPKKSMGTISISAKKLESGAIEIRIEDDGVGLYKKLGKRNEHVSVSTTLTKERLKLLSQISGQLHSITVLDKRESGLDEDGVIVTIVLPAY